MLNKKLDDHEADLILKRNVKHFLKAVPSSSLSSVTIKQSIAESAVSSHGWKRRNGATGRSR